MAVSPAPDFIKKLDSFFAREDVGGASAYLEELYRRFSSNGESGNLLTVLDEIIGLCRQTGEESRALSAIEEAKELVEKLGLENSVTAGTVCLNCATTLKCFGKSAQAMPFYEKTGVIYDRFLDENDPLKAGLYNNMALALADIGKTDQAEEYFRKAIAVTLTDKRNALETAVSYVNLAHLLFDKNPIDKEIDTLLDSAYEILLTPDYFNYDKYAFTCRKCAPSFGYFGRFLQEKKLNERADEVYAGA